MQNVYNTKRFTFVYRTKDQLMISVKLTLISHICVTVEVPNGTCN